MLEWMTKHKNEIKFHSDAEALQEYIKNIRGGCSLADIDIYFREKKFGTDKGSANYCASMARGDMFYDQTRPGTFS